MRSGCEALASSPLGGVGQPILGHQEEKEASVCVSVSAYKACIANMIKQKPTSSL